MKRNVITTYKMPEIKEIANGGGKLRDGFWCEENTSQQHLYIQACVTELLRITEPVEYLCMFHINDLLKINSSIALNFGVANTYKYLEGPFGFPRYLLACNKNVPAIHVTEFIDFCDKVTRESGINFIQYDATKATGNYYNWMNYIHTKEEWVKIAQWYRSDKRYARTMNIPDEKEPTLMGVIANTNFISGVSAKHSYLLHQ